MKSRLKTGIESAFFTLLAVTGVYFLTKTDSFQIIGAGSFFSFLFAVLLYYLYTKRIEAGLFANKRKLIFSAVFAFFLGLSFFLGYQLRNTGMTTPGFAGKLSVCAKGLLLGFVFLPFVETLFAFADSMMQKKAKETSLKWKPSRMLLISWGIIFVCWIPVFLAYFPGIMSYDSNRQFTEAYGAIFWDLQPIFHTLMIRGALLLGQAMGGYEWGVAIYSLLQMLVLSFAIAFSLSFVYELTKKRSISVLLAVFFGVFPVFSVLALCVTKDIFFSSFFLCLCVLSMKRFLKKPKKPILYDLGMLGCGIMMCLFRKNGIYGFALFAVLYVIAMKKERLRILILCLITLAAAFGSVRLVRLAVNGAPGPKIEMYSVPIQQMARVAYYQRELLTDEELNTLENYIVGSTTTDSFNVSLADGPKFNANAEAWLDTKQMLKDWSYFAKKYPNDYLDAPLGLTAGYWFPDDISISQYLGYGRENRRGLIETFNASKPIEAYFEGVESKSYLPGLEYFLEGIVSDEQYLNWPLVSALFRPANYCWLMILFFGILLYQKRYRAFAAASLQLTYYCTVLLGPVANIRYVFQIMIGLPALMAFVFAASTEGKEETLCPPEEVKEPVSSQEESGT